MIREDLQKDFDRWSESLEGLRVPPLEGSEIDVAVFGAEWAIEKLAKKAEKGITNGPITRYFLEAGDIRDMAKELMEGK